MGAPRKASSWAPISGLFSDLLDLCDGAARAITDHYEDEALSGMLRKKKDASPLTAADLASHRLLSRGLRELSPQIPILSEESDAQDIEDRLQWERCWMLDPLDGTREFLDRTGEFTINVAFIEEQRSVLGIIYKPLSRQGYLGIEGSGAWRVWHDGTVWQSEVISTRALQDDALVVFASRRHRNAKLDTTLAFLEESRSLQRRNSGSALKFCDLAVGDGDCYPRFSPCSEWDVAAGDALVSAAGGAVLGMDGERLRYNARESLLSPHFLAIGDAGPSLWNELLAKLR